MKEKGYGGEGVKGVKEVGEGWQKSIGQKMEESMASLRRCRKYLAKR